MNSQGLDELYPFDTPDGKDPWAGLFVHAAGLDMDTPVVEALADHVRKLGFVHHGYMQEVTKVKLAVGLPVDDATHRADPGEKITITVTENPRSYVWVRGVAPHGLGLTEAGLSGAVAEMGVWEFEIVHGPALHFDPLGYGGAPLEPGQWVPIDEPVTMSFIDATAVPVEEMDDTQLALLQQRVAATMKLREKEGETS